MSLMIKFSKEAIPLIILFRERILHSKAFRSQKGVSPNAARNITIIPTNIIRLSKGITIKLVTKNNPGN